MEVAEKLLTVFASDRSFALPIRDVVEIVRVRAISRVPQAPDSLLGITNFRNTALPVVSLARLLGSPKSEHDDDTRIVVISDGHFAGLLVDRVGGISETGDHQILDTRNLLRRDFSATPRRSTAVQVSTDHPTTAGGDGDGHRDREAFISFEVAEQDYALPLAQVLAITDLPRAVTAVPRTDDAIAGVVEIGSELVPLVSLRALLGLPRDDSDGANAHVVVVQCAGKSTGLIVDSMKSILRVEASSLDAVPSVLTRGTGEASINAICRLDGGRLVSILAVDRLFDAETMRRLADTARSGGLVMASADETAAKEQFVVFELGRERYGIPIALVDEIVRRPQRLTRVPRAPSFVDGIMNLRGKMIPVIDQRQRFSVGGSEDRRARRVIILTIDGLQIGIVVDKVSEILSFDHTDLKPAPEMKASGAVIDRVAIGHAEGDMVLMIDPRVLLDHAERDMLAALRDLEGQRE